MAAPAAAATATATSTAAARGAAGAGAGAGASADLQHDGLRHVAKEQARFYLESHTYLDSRQVLFLRDSASKETEKAEDAKKAKAKTNERQHVETIVIMDISASMGDHVAPLVNTVVPMTLTALGYADTDQVSMIFFHTNSRLETKSIAEWKATSQYRGGMTYMASAFPFLNTWLAKIPDESRVQIIALSDGDVHDPDKTQEEAAKIQAYLATRRLQIHSLALRYGSSAQAAPDTRALASVLQFSNFKPATTIMEIPYQQDRNTTIAQVALALDHDEFKSVRYEVTAFLRSHNGNNDSKDAKEAKQAKEAKEATSSRSFGFAVSPIDTTLTPTLKVAVDRPIWFAAESLENISFSLNNSDGSTSKHQTLACQKGEPLTASNYTTLFEQPIRFYMNRLRVLKVINTPESKTEIDAMVAFFEGIERSFRSTVSVFKDRLKSYASVAGKLQRSVAHEMRALANDNKVGQLNAAQQADYLRQIDGASLLAKNLAKRAETYMSRAQAQVQAKQTDVKDVKQDVKEGVVAGAAAEATDVKNDAKEADDWPTILRRELTQASKHINELDSLSPDDHAVSFYSQTSTLEGLRSLSEIVLSDKLKDIENQDLLKCVNLVGVATSDGVEGDFPDPMVYRVRKIWPNTYVSMADLMTVKSSQMHLPAAERQGLDVPGQPKGKHDTRIHSCVPIYDDLRIAAFLQKYMPNTLEFYGSIAMRGLIAPIAHTNAYLMVAGSWKMIEEIHRHPTELNLKAFRTMLLSFEHTIGTQFDYVQGLLKSLDPTKTKASLYIGNNGITNMMAPLLKLYRGNSKSAKGVIQNDANLIPQVLRALLSFEMYQTVRKRMHKSPNPPEFPMATMKALLGSPDLSVRATPLTPDFEPNPNINNLQFNTDYVVDTKLLDTWCSYSKHADLMVLLPHLMHGVAATPSNIPLTGAETKDYCDGMHNVLPKALDEATLRKAYGVNYDVQMLKFYTLVQCILYNSVDHRVCHQSKTMKIQDLVDVKVADAMVRETVRGWRLDYYQQQLVQKAKKEQQILQERWITHICDEKDIKLAATICQTGLTVNQVVF